MRRNCTYYERKKLEAKRKKNWKRNERKIGVKQGEIESEMKEKLEQNETKHQM